MLYTVLIRVIALPNHTGKYENHHIKAQQAQNSHKTLFPLGQELGFLPLTGFVMPVGIAFTPVLTLHRFLHFPVLLLVLPPQPP